MVAASLALFAAALLLAAWTTARAARRHRAEVAASRRLSHQLAEGNGVCERSPRW